MIGQECGYAKAKKLTIPTREKVEAVFSRLNLDAAALDQSLGGKRTMWKMIVDYLTYRATVLHDHFDTNLMDAAAEAAQL